MEKSEVGVLGYGTLPLCRAKNEVTCVRREVGRAPSGRREPEEEGRGAPPILKRICREAGKCSYAADRAPASADCGCSLAGLA